MSRARAASRAVVLLGTALCAVLVFNHAPMIELALNADTLLPFSFAWDLAHTPGAWRAHALARIPSLLPDLTALAPILLATGSVRWSLLLYGAAQALAFVQVAGLLAVRLGRAAPDDAAHADGCAWVFVLFAWLVGLELATASHGITVCRRGLLPLPGRAVGLAGDRPRRHAAAPSPGARRAGRRRGAGGLRAGRVRRPGRVATRRAALGPGRRGLLAPTARAARAARRPRRLLGGAADRGRHRLVDAGRPADGEGHAFDWGNDPRWYRHALADPSRAPRYDFIVMRSLPPGRILAAYGPPDQVEPCADTALWVYRDDAALTAALLAASPGLER